MSLIFGQQSQNNNNSFLQSGGSCEIEPKSQKGYYFMRTDDIDGASPCKNKFKTSCQRMTNPLSPEYKLPSVRSYSNQNSNQKQNSFSNTSFIRDNLYVKDIEGTYAKPRNWGQQRNVDPYTEIEGSKTRQQRVYSKPNYSLDVTDINQDGIHKRNRSTNPLEPRYKIPHEKDYGYIDGTESLSKKPRIIIQTRESNKNRDIELAWVNSANDRRFFMDQRRKDKNPIDISDIEGAKAETNKLRLITKRHLNPLVPNYIMPGHTENITNQDVIKKPYYRHQQV